MQKIYFKTYNFTLSRCGQENHNKNFDLLITSKIDLSSFRFFQYLMHRVWAAAGVREEKIKRETN